MPVRRRRLALSVAALVVLAACQTRIPGCGGPAIEEHVDPLASAQPSRPENVPESKRVEIAFLGDSITAGLGLRADQAFPAKIQDMFTKEGYGEVESLNGGVSGDTTAGGLRRVDQLISANTRILVVALGGNDALRGLTVQETHDNLAAIIEAARAKGVTVMLVGMEAPTNLGEDYRTGFRNAFIRVSQEYKGSIYYVPFLLEGVAGNPALNQADGIHPTEEGARIVAEHLYPSLRDMVDQMPAPAG